MEKGGYNIMNELDEREREREREQIRFLKLLIIVENARVGNGRRLLNPANKTGIQGERTLSIQASTTATYHIYIN
jgi:hypothetical protein